jgi:hypothetical protein
LAGGCASRGSGRWPHDGGLARSLAGPADAHGHEARIASPPKARRTRTATQFLRSRRPEAC